MTGRPQSRLGSGRAIGQSRGQHVTRGRVPGRPQSRLGSGRAIGRSRVQTALFFASWPIMTLGRDSGNVADPQVSPILIHAGRTGRPPVLRPARGPSFRLLPATNAERAELRCGLAITHARRRLFVGGVGCAATSMRLRVLCGSIRNGNGSRWICDSAHRNRRVAPSTSALVCRNV